MRVCIALIDATASVFIANYHLNRIGVVLAVEVNSGSIAASIVVIHADSLNSASWLVRLR